jgi:cytochrome c biogenesis protein CcmG, thiol:disulfide interchange protein DsbE
VSKERGKKNILMLAAGLLVGLGMGLFVLVSFGRLEVSRSPEGGRGGAISAPIVGSKAPEFTLQTLDGETISLSDLEGKAVLINFWATWCEPCKIEMPFFQERYERYSPNFDVLAVNYAEPEDTVRRFVESEGLTFTILLDRSAQVVRQYQVRGYPTTVMVDPDGIIQVYHIGIVTQRQLDGYLKTVGVGE